MDSLSLVSQIIDRWQALRAAGQNVSAAELCQNRPDLLPEVARQIHILDRASGLALPDVPADLAVTDPHIRLPTSQALPTPRWPQVPGYEMLGVLGHGGMGVVYKARHGNLKRIVALKMLRDAHRARDEDMIRFRAEAEAVARLSHPGIVQIYDIGEYDGLPYFSIEFCPGGSLDRKLRGVPQPPREAARLVEVLAQAVHAAHQGDVIHRDLKPGNVLLGLDVRADKREGTTRSGLSSSSPGEAEQKIALADQAPKVCDFGLARAIDGERTQSGRIVGTPSYMAPEQAEGKKDLGRGVDVWALGAILYECLTGRPPFRGASITETLELVRFAEPISVRRQQPGVPRDLETICLKCLHKQPERRYARAEALADDLQRFLEGKPIAARPVSRLERMYCWCRRRPAEAALLAAGAVVMLAGPALGVWVSGQSKVLAALSQASKNAEQAKEAAEKLAALRKYSASVGTARAEIADHRPGWTWRAWDALKNAGDPREAKGDPQEMRTLATACLGGVDLGNERILAKGVHAGVLRFSPDGRQLLVGEALAWGWIVGHCFLVDPISGKTIRTLEFPAGFAFTEGRPVQDGPRDAVFSPDGAQVFVGTRAGNILHYDLTKTGSTPASSWSAHRGEVTALTLAPDGPRLYSSSPAGDVRQWPVPAGQTKPGFRFAGDQVVFSLAWKSGAQPGLLCAREYGVTALDAETLVPEGGRLVGSAEKNSLIVYHTPSRTLVRASGGRLSVWNGEREPFLHVRDLTGADGAAAHTDTVAGLALSADGTLLASTGNGALKLWNLVSGRLMVSIALGDKLWKVAISPDGKLLAATGYKQTYLYEVAGQNVQTFVAQTGLPIRDMRAVRDGRGLVLLSAIHGRLVLAEASVREEAAKLLWSDGYPADVVDVRLASDSAGRRLAFQAGFHRVNWMNAADGGPQPTPYGGGTGLSNSALIDADMRLWTLHEDVVQVRRLEKESALVRWKNRDLLLTGFKQLDSLAVGQRYAVTGSSDGQVHLLHQANAEHVASWSSKGGAVLALALDRDERQAAVGRDDGRVQVRSLPEGEMVTDLKPHSDKVTCLAFHHGAGEWLASGSLGGKVVLWGRVGKTYEPQVRISMVGGRGVRRVAFDANDNLLVLLERETAVRVWNVRKLTERLAELKCWENR